MHDKIIEREFNDWAIRGDAEPMAKGHSELVEWIFDRWKKPSKGLLDLGCGVGDLIKRAKNRGYTQLAGIDLSSKMIQKAKHLILDADLKVGSAQTLPWERSSFSRVISIESLYYHESPLKTFQETMRVLRPGGKFATAIELYSETPVGALWEKILAEEKELNVHLWSEAQWIHCLKKAEFKEIYSTRIVRKTSKSKDEFQPSGYFPNFEIYTAYIQSGALYIEGLKKF